ncbi:hypothetical protein BE21_45555 [Sorangium cellulosum]|uniref:Uncharacterized protein n=1 Tax=Sorangium cellulosum TaxID=56 RepID=A0A150TJ14_SORCE|nr:hypothetical protein BE21_45555 [Sorangium cellulosum]
MASSGSAGRFTWSSARRAASPPPFEEGGAAWGEEAWDGEVGGRGAAGGICGEGMRRSGDPGA